MLFWCFHCFRWPHSPRAQVHQGNFASAHNVRILQVLFVLHRCIAAVNMAVARVRSWALVGLEFVQLATFHVLQNAGVFDWPFIFSSMSTGPEELPVAADGLVLDRTRVRVVDPHTGASMDHYFHAQPNWTVQWPLSASAERTRAQSDQSLNARDDDTAPAKDLEFNYASHDAGAKVLAAARGMEKVKKVLEDDVDNYMLVPSALAAKWMVVQLSEDILVDSFSLWNRELYSSSIHEFHVLSSNQYPTESWFLLGRFQMANHRAPQFFTLRTPHWARFINIRIVNLHDASAFFYCTLTSFQVFGQTVVQVRAGRALCDERA
jgi:hypothetical protein